MTNPKKVIRNIIMFNIHMLKGLKLLQHAQYPIVHNDIKDGNVIYDETHGHPVYIDFGLSYQIKDVVPENVARIFYTDRTYTPWAFDITLLSYIQNT